MNDMLIENRPHLHRLLETARTTDPIPTAVVHPVDCESLLGVMAATRAGLIEPLLIGPRQKILAAAGTAAVEPDSFEMIDVQHSHAAAAKATELVHTGSVAALMKGSLHTDELMRAVIGELRTERRISHVFVFDVPTYERLLFITDAAVNIRPDLDAKRDITQNAIDLAGALGIDTPKVAVLSAVETVNPRIQSTLDAAALGKMADRRQITGGLVDGPLAFDNAVSAAAADIKNIVSPVAGQADILVVPDLESGNMLAKQLEDLGDAEGAGIVLGARVPIVLTSRADDTVSRMASCALAKLLVRHREGQLG